MAVYWVFCHQGKYTARNTLNK